MNRLVEFCTNNMHHGTDDVMRRVEERPDVDTIEYGCLGNCGQCYLEPFALVDGDIVAAETAEALYEKILEKLNEAEIDPFADLPLD
ncbi:YuzB family protein [Paenibacillus sp. TRM 82003]|nr:YuzB family protein [Paenibacillus sp. TRM 82003]